MDTPGSVEVLVYLLGKDHLYVVFDFVHSPLSLMLRNLTPTLEHRYAEEISNKIVEMLTVMVFEAEDLIGVEELRRDQDESYTVDLKAAVPRRVTDAFRKMQDRCKENVAFEGFEFGDTTREASANIFELSSALGSNSERNSVSSKSYDSVEYVQTRGSHRRVLLRHEKMAYETARRRKFQRG